MSLTQLHQKEYEKLQQEISQTMAEIGSLERFSLLTSGGIFTWLLTHQRVSEHAVGYFLPAILVLLFGLITLGHFNRLKLMGRYIQEKYEVLLNVDQAEGTAFGWETYLSKSLHKSGSLLANSRLLMWVLHLLGDLTIAFVLTCNF